MKLLLPLAALVLSAAVTQGQSSFDISAGGNQTYDAYGVKTVFKLHGISGWTGVGYSDGFRFGTFESIPLHGNTRFGVGDQQLPGYLDVDADAYDPYTFTVRGVNFVKESATNGLQMFSGFLTQDRAYPFLHTSTTSGVNFKETPLVAIMSRRKLTDTLQTHGMFIFDGKTTVIESIGWNPSKKWAIAAAAGMGSNSGYLAGKGQFKLDRVEGWASYTISSKEFHRENVPFFTSEPAGLNARTSYTPWPWLKLSYDHNKNRAFIPSFPTVESSYDSAHFYTAVKGFQVGASYGRSRTNNLPRHSLSEVFSIQRRILPRWRAFGAFIQMDSPTFNQVAYVATNEFKVSSRLAIRQNYNRMNGQDTFSAGATWLSNWLSFEVDQQTYMSPLAPSFGGQSIFSAWTFNIRFRTPHGTNTYTSSYVTPDGRVQWGGYLSGLRYTTVGIVNTSPVFAKYIVRGTVVDEAGNGVWGIAVNIGPETVVSDNDGVFFIHVKNTKRVPFAVAANASLQGQRWTLSSAPTSVQGMPEGTVEPIRVVVQMGNYNRKVAQMDGN